LSAVQLPGLAVREIQGIYGGGACGVDLVPAIMASTSASEAIVGVMGRMKLARMMAFWGSWSPNNCQLKDPVATGKEPVLPPAAGWSWSGNRGLACFKGSGCSDRAQQQIVKVCGSDSDQWYFGICASAAPGSVDEQIALGSDLFFSHSRIIITRV